MRGECDRLRGGRVGVVETVGVGAQAEFVARFRRQPGERSPCIVVGGVDSQHIAQLHARFVGAVEAEQKASAAKLCFGILPRRSFQQRQRLSDLSFPGQDVSQAGEHVGILRRLLQHVAVLGFRFRQVSGPAQQTGSPGVRLQVL